MIVRTITKHLLTTFTVNSLILMDISMPIMDGEHCLPCNDERVPSADI
jgi:CheY-like chemotaxis protein